MKTYGTTLRCLIPDVSVFNVFQAGNYITTGKDGIV